MRPPGKKSEKVTKKECFGKERATGKKDKVKLHLHVTILVLLKNPKVV